MKLFPRHLSDSNDNSYWRVKARGEQASAQAFGRQREQAEQLANDLAQAWNASEPTNTFNERSYSNAIVESVR